MSAAKQEWPQGYAAGTSEWKPPPERPVTLENAIMFGFKLAIGMSLFFVPLGIVALILIALVSSIH